MLRQRSATIRATLSVDNEFRAALFMATASVEWNSERGSERGSEGGSERVSVTIESRKIQSARNIKSRVPPRDNIT